MRTSFFMCVCLVAGMAGAEPIGFSKYPKYVTNANDGVVINGTDHGVIAIKTELAVTRPAKIKMKMRRTATSARNPGHFGVELYGGDGLKVHYYSHDGANFIASMYQGKARSYDNSVRGQAVVFPAQADAPWVDVELYVQPKLAEIHIAGVPRGMVNDSLLPLTGIGLYGYHNDIEVKDLSWEPLPEAEKMSADPQPSFYASFDQGEAGLTAQGERQPSRTANLESVPGVAGQAVRIEARDKAPASQPQLEYAAKGLFADYGTLMFWIKTDWDGRYTGDIPIYPMIEGVDDAGRRKLAVAMTWWIAFTLGRTGNLRSEEMKRDSRPTWYRGDWNHIAMVWSEGDWCKAYLNACATDALRPRFAETHPSRTPLSPT